jgi:hypothetical protein
MLSKKLTGKITGGVLLCLCTLNTAYAGATYSAKAKIDKVTVKVNNEEKVFEAGEEISLEENDIICFSSGKGEVSIKSDNYKVRLHKGSASCEVIPSTEKQSSFKRLGAKLAWLFPDDPDKEKNSERSIAGTAKGDLRGAMEGGAINIGEEEYLIMENETWGPLPLTLEVLDGEGNVIKSSINNNEPVFVVPADIFEKGYKVKVYNAFHDVYVESTVVKN